MKIAPLYRSNLITCSKRRGFTLLELGMVLGIMGMILAAIWVAASSVGVNNQVDQASQELQAVSQNMLTFYEGRTWPPTLVTGCTDVTGNAIAAGVIPSTNVTGTCTASQVWGGSGTFTISANAAGPGLGNTFRISYTKVPLQACIKLLMQATACDPTQPGCPMQVLAGATVKTPGLSTAGGWQASTALTPITATTFCNLNGASGTVAFDFKI